MAEARAALGLNLPLRVPPGGESGRTERRLAFNIGEDRSDSGVCLDWRRKKQKREAAAAKAGFGAIKEEERAGKKEERAGLASELEQIHAWYCMQVDGTHDVTPCLRWRLKLKEAVEGYDAEARAHDKQMLDALTTAEMTERQRSMCSNMAVLVTDATGSSPGCLSEGLGPPSARECEDAPGTSGPSELRDLGARPRPQDAVFAAFDHPGGARPARWGRGAATTGRCTARGARRARARTTPPRRRATTGASTRPRPSCEPRSRQQRTRSIS